MLATRLVLVPMLACMLVTWAGSFLVAAQTATQARDSILRAASITVWLSPLILLLGERSLWAIAVMAWIAASATLLFRSASLPTSQVSPAQPGQSLFMPEHPAPIRRLLLPFLAGAIFQAGLLARAIGEKLVAILLVGAGTALAIALYRSRGRDDIHERKSSFRRLLLIVALGIVINAAGLVRFLAMSGSLAQDSVVSLLISEIFGRHPRRAENRPQPEQGNYPTGAVGTGGGYRGVFLWPDVDPHPILFVPPMPKLAPVFIVPTTRPVDFTFTGEYWFFKPPDLRPPELSPKIRGNPAKIGMHSSDDYPMAMEAHQKFSGIVDLRCCSKIQVVIKNADRYSQSVYLELAVRNSVLPLSQEQTLGRKKVLSTPQIDTNGDAVPIEEVLTFEVPARIAVPEFDEMTIRFRRSYLRAHASSRIAIEKFVFGPR
jgi:hypothetical protein